MILEQPSVRFEAIHAILSSEGNVLTVSELCETAGVSRSGYYRWLSAAGAREKREEADRADFELILEAYSHRGYQKGARSIYMSLLHRNPPVVMNVKKIRRLMDKYDLSCPIRKANPYRRMAKALRTGNVADNLLKREFRKYGPRMVLLTDITYLPYNGAFAYLSVILYCTSKIFTVPHTAFLSSFKKAKVFFPTGTRLWNSWTPLPIKWFIFSLFSPSVLLMVESIFCLNASKLS